VYATIAGIADASPDAAALIDSFYALDGGRPYKDLTVEQFDTQKADHEWIGLKQDALNTVAAAHDESKAEFRKAESSPESIIAAALALLGG
jgi:hypothetical protein